MNMIRHTLVQFPLNPTPEVPHDDKNFEHKRETEMKIEPNSDDSEQKGNSSDEEGKDLVYLEEALKNVLNSSTVIMKEEEILKQFQMRLLELENENNKTLENFFNAMDQLSTDVCINSREALWSYVNDADNVGKKKYMLNIVKEDEEIKRKYWQILKERYKSDIDNATDPRLQRRIYRIHNRDTNAQIPDSEERSEINEMQSIWALAMVCPYNVSTCNADNTNLTIKDLTSVFETSNDTDELAYYWKSYRDATGRKIRPLFEKYVIRMNNFANSEGFHDMSEMWFFAFEDDNFVTTVQTLWNDVKPLYNVLHDYVRTKLKIFYEELYKRDEKSVPAHLLGTMWAQEWQAIYSKVVPYPEHHLSRLISNDTVKPKYLLDIVDEFHRSLGFESARGSYENIDESSDSNCLPSSHDMCDGINYRIRWCDDKVADVNVGLSRAARLLGHIQYFKHYRNLSLIFRDAPNPAKIKNQLLGLRFSSPEEVLEEYEKYVSELTNPLYLKSLNNFEVDTSVEANVNYLLWVALEKIPLMAYAKVLDEWRWDIFNAESEVGANEKWNEHWWELRERETGITAPLPRNESDLDPASKYQVVSHIQYITNNNEEKKRERKRKNDDVIDDIKRKNNGTW
ncbi:Angiotensin-converting enzyme [Eumeta japonica]|uniref:Angiotensin-converting enzyme n=1 Tax=Eumeta variegata TaxID=151549 RepID=A0A4C1T3S6_EUMVA|nr:Angiotensin-converting enzyme [Eumeta japonica]